MGKSDNILKFEEALRTDPEKQKAFEKALEKIAEEKSVESESEAFVKAAKELGFDLTIEEIERSFAEKQEMGDDELDEVAGGKWCWKDHDCVCIYHVKEECSNGTLCTLNHTLCDAAGHCGSNYYYD